MKRLVKWLVIVTAVGAVLFGASYLGVRARVGTFLGTKLPNLGARTIYFAYQGVPELPGHPRAWIVAYGPTEIREARDIRFYVTLTGKIIQTFPHDLEARLDPYRDVMP